MTLARAPLAISTTLLAACLVAAPPTPVEPATPVVGASSSAASSSASGSATAAPTPPPPPDPRLRACVAYADRICACDDAACAKKIASESLPSVREGVLAMGPSEQQWCNSALGRASGCEQELRTATYESFARAACACTSVACWNKESAIFRANGGKDPSPDDADRRATSALGRAQGCRAKLISGAIPTTLPTGSPPANACKQDGDCVLIQTTCGCSAQHRLDPIEPERGPMACAKDRRCMMASARCEVASGQCRRADVGGL